MLAKRRAMNRQVLFSQRRLRNRAGDYKYNCYQSLTNGPIEGTFSMRRGLLFYVVEGHKVSASSAVYALIIANLVAFAQHAAVSITYGPLN
jgi:hypothetical protein